MPEGLRGLTTRGRGFAAAGGLVVVAAVLVGNPDVLRVGVLLLALPLAAAYVLTRTRYRLAATRALDHHRVAVGTDATVTLRLDNVSRLPTGLLLLEERVPYSLGARPRFVLDRVEARGRREVSYTVSSATRGQYPMGPLSLRLTDPFGMCELTRAFASRTTLVVTPPVHPLPAVRLTGSWAGSGEARARSLAAAGEDDSTTREYRNGDDLRRVHWRSSARLGSLMVRREEQPWQSRCNVLLDTRLRAHRGEGPQSSLEWAISAAASITLDLSRRGYQVRLMTDTGASLSSAGRDEDGITADFQGALLDSLAVLEGSSSQGLQGCERALGRGGADGLLVAVLGRTDAEQAAYLARLRRGRGVGIAVLLDTASWAPPTRQQPAAADGEYDGAVRLLRHAGWRVVRAAAHQSIREVWPMAGSENAAAQAGEDAALDADRTRTPTGAAW